MKGNVIGVKLLFLASVYVFPYYCNTIYLIIIIKWALEQDIQVLQNGY